MARAEAKAVPIIASVPAGEPNELKNVRTAGAERLASSATAAITTVVSVSVIPCCLRFAFISFYFLFVISSKLPKIPSGPAETIKGKFPTVEITLPKVKVSMTDRDKEMMAAPAGTDAGGGLSQVCPVTDGTGV